jgi:uncharacterized protein
MLEATVLSMETFRVIKPEIRVLGIDDAAHIPRSKSYVPIIGVVFRGGFWLEGVMSTKILVDGFDSTPAISDMIKESPHFKQLRVVLLNGVTFGGFNIVDLKALNEKIWLPIIAVARKKPDLISVHQAIQKLSHPEERLKALNNAGEIISIQLKSKKTQLYCHLLGIQLEDAQKILDLTSTRSITPEPLRVAHLIASGIRGQNPIMEKV